MKKLALASLFAFGCAASPAADQARLVAGADAQHVGVYAYAADHDVVTLFDRYGLELGRVTVTAPSREGRHFELVAVDGTMDEADVVRPIKDGRFLAPVTPETMLTATMGDEALASFWAQHQLQFTIDLAPRLSSQIVPSDIAVTTACSSYACGQACAPDGCAKPANTSVGCTNPAQLPATRSLAGLSWVVEGVYVDEGCTYNNAQTCADRFGGDASDYPPLTGVKCMGNGPVPTQWTLSCRLGTSTNSWVASCPRVTCGTVGQYDSVPRNGSCNSPGSCTYSQGAVGCTAYH
jgi:hypothetical protein